MTLEIKNLYAGYEDLNILWDITITVEKGQRVSLVGSNGGGKSTLLKTVAGLLRPSKGEIQFNGSGIGGLKSSEIVRRGISLIPEGYKLFTGMTVHENLLLGAYLERDRKKKNDQVEKVYQIFPELQKRQSQLAGTMSGGEQQMCSIGRGLMSSPQLLLIDELSLGLAPLLVEVLIEKINEIHLRTNMSVLLVEQDVESAFSIADYGYVLESGKITLSGDPKELLENPVIMTSYLGV
jgi:branched-chain amino acid transport system ATP-binding protein